MLEYDLAVLLVLVIHILLSPNTTPNVFVALLSLRSLLACNRS